MPFGRPVVPDEYNMSAPVLSSAIGVVGIASRSRSHDRYGATVSPTMNSSRPGNRDASCCASSAMCEDVMKSFAPQSSTMYCASAAVAFDEMQTRYVPERWFAQEISR